MNKFITIATTHENLRLIRRICAETGEKQHELLKRLLEVEDKKVNNQKENI